MMLPTFRATAEVVRMFDVEVIWNGLVVGHLRGVIVDMPQYGASGRRRECRPSRKRFGSPKLPCPGERCRSGRWDFEVSLDLVESPVSGWRPGW